MASTPYDDGAKRTVLPYDPLVVVAGLVGRSPWLIVAVVVGLTLAYVTATRIMHRTWTSRAVLLRSRSVETSDDSLGLLALSRLVTLPDVLARLRQELSLPLRLEELGTNVDVEVQPRTGILTLSYTDGRPERAYRILQSLLELFQSTMQTVQEQQLGRQLEYCRDRLAEVRRDVVTSWHRASRTSARTDNKPPMPTASPI